MDLRDVWEVQSISLHDELDAGIKEGRYTRKTLWFPISTQESDTIICSVKLHQKALLLPFFNEKITGERNLQNEGFILTSGIQFLVSAKVASYIASKGR